MLCHAHIRQLIRSLSAGTTKCCLVFDGYGSSRKDSEHPYSTCDESSTSLLNGFYLILLLIFSSIHWAGVGKWIKVTSPFTAGLQWLLLKKTSNFFYNFYDVLTVPGRVLKLSTSSFYIFSTTFQRACL